MSYQVRLEGYEGPLDLLLRLVEREQIEVGSVSVRKVIDQYLEHLKQLNWSDINEGSRFLVMAATLLAVKARLLLPRYDREESEEGETGDEAEQLDFGDQLADYMEFRQAAQQLEERSHDWQLRFKHPPEPLPTVRPRMRREDVSLLVQSLQELLKRHAGDDSYQVERSPVDLEQTMKLLVRQLDDNPDGLFFEQLLAASAGREEMIVTFLALLELVYQGVIRVSQDHPGGAILIQRLVNSDPSPVNDHFDDYA